MNEDFIVDFCILLSNHSVWSVEKIRIIYNMINSLDDTIKTLQLADRYKCDPLDVAFIVQHSFPLKI